MDYLETNRLIIRKEEQNDIKELYNIISLEEINNYLVDFNYNNIEDFSKKNINSYTIELKEDKTIIGEINYKDNIIETFIDPIYQNKGYCYESICELLKYLFLKESVEKVTSHIKDNNEKANNLLNKISFKKQQKNNNIIEYSLIKNDFLKELFRKEKLYIEIDIDKDPYILHITDDNIINITGESGSGKTTSIEQYKDKEDFIIIDTDQVYGKNKDKDNEEIYNMLISKYNELPNLLENIDTIYNDILEYYKNSNKFIIIDSALLRYIKDVSILKGELIVLRTSINTCFNRCIERYKKNNPNASFEEIIEYSNRKKNMYIWYNNLNKFLDRVDKYYNKKG